MERLVSNAIADCECSTWGRDNHGAILFLSHHPNCVNYKPEPEVRTLIFDLLQGIEAWAADEDGIHPGCWAAYKKACHVVGAFQRAKEC